MCTCECGTELCVVTLELPKEKLLVLLPLQIAASKYGLHNWCISMHRLFLHGLNAGLNSRLNVIIGCMPIHLPKRRVCKTLLGWKLTDALVNPSIVLLALTVTIEDLLATRATHPGQRTTKAANC